MRLNWSSVHRWQHSEPSSELEWAYASMDLSDEFNLQIGKQKYDVMREYMVNAEFQQAIERSLYTYYWGTSSITNGIKLNYAERHRSAPT